MPSTSGRVLMVVSLVVDNVEEWVVAVTGGLGERSRFVDRPGVRVKELRVEKELRLGVEGSPGREVGNCRLFDLRKILPNIFLVALEGCASGPEELEGRDTISDLGAAGEIWPIPLSLLPSPLSCPPSILVRALGIKTEGASPHTSTGSNTARLIISNPRFWNFATLISVPASTTVFVITLWACRL